jgi:N-acetylglucosaminyldiphosphoundecaprenol N-acetyl-beta-D-mannosaminyltransferase
MRFEENSDVIAKSAGILVTVNMQHIFTGTMRELVLGSSDSNYIFILDGKGAQSLLNRHFGTSFSKLSGNVLVEEILSGSESNEKILIVGSNESVIRDLMAMYPHLDIVHDDVFLHSEADSYLEQAALMIHNKFPNDFRYVMLALGVPKQERLARHLLQYYPNSLIMCIGGSFEIITGRFARAPEFLSKIGLESIWRFLQQPSIFRLKRMIRSLFEYLRLSVFPNALKFMLNEVKK